MGHAALFPWVCFHRYWLHAAYDVSDYVFYFTAKQVALCTLSLLSSP